MNDLRNRVVKIALDCVCLAVGKLVTRWSSCLTRSSQSAFPSLLFTCQVNPSAVDFIVTMSPSDIHLRIPQCPAPLFTSMGRSYLSSPLVI